MKITKIAGRDRNLELSQKIIPVLSQAVNEGIITQQELMDLRENFAVVIPRVLSRYQKISPEIQTMLDQQ